MALQNVHSKETRLVLSSDAKPRLKWTSELHQRFVDAVEQLGGAEKATPKSLMRVMAIHGLTLYHLKSHLQKYRMGRSQQSQTDNQNKQEDCGEKLSRHCTSKACDGAKEQINESLHMTKALRMQMEVQRKLHEHIEVQTHLQLRIEAQGKYLQSVLRKAQETLSEYGPSSIEAERVKAQLSELVSMVDSGCPTSSLSVLTQSEGSMLRHETEKLLGRHGCSLESSLTSSESSWRKDETRPNEADENNKHESGHMTRQEQRSFIALSLMEMHPVEKNESESQANERKRGKSAAKNIEQSSSKRLRFLDNIDLNCKSLNDFDSGPRMIDLNSKGDGNF